MISRFTDRTDELLIEQSKTQRLSILEQQYQMKQEALEKATDLIALLSDELESIRSTSNKTIETYKNKLNEYELKTRILEKRLKQLQQLISHKQSRIMGIPPLSRRSNSGDKKQTKSRIKQEFQQNYSQSHIEFLKNLANILLTKVFQTHKQTQYLFNSQLEMIEQKREKIRQYYLQMTQFNNTNSNTGPTLNKQELFEIISQQQQIINKLKNHISVMQTCIIKSTNQDSIFNLQQSDGYNLINELKILIDIVTQSIRSKSNTTKSTDYRINRGREIEPPYQYIARMEALASKQKYLSNQNKQLKNIIEGLIAHIKR